MKPMPLVSLLSIACAAVALSAEPKPDQQLRIYPKNLARQHLGSNLFLFDASTNTYKPTEASAAWLDDDISTGWPILAGKQYYLLAFPQPELVTNFALSARPANGTVSVYAADEPGPPNAKAWAAIARDVPVESVNERKLNKPFSRLAKYLLIETNIADPGPVYSLYVYGDKPATAYQFGKREQSIDSRAIFGPYQNNQTAFNVAGLYAQGSIGYVNTGDGYVGWQRAVDDNPESGISITPSTDKSGATVRYAEKRAVSRISLLTDPGTKGKLDFYLVDSAGNEAAVPRAETLGDRIPSVSVVLDGTAARSSIEFPAIQSSEMLVRWTPSEGSDPINLRELNAFGDSDLSTYAVSMKPEAVAEFGGDEKLADNSKDGKTLKDGKEAKDALPPVGEFLPQRFPYLPGGLGFPPNLVSRRPVLPPDQPVSQ